MRFQKFPGNNLVEYILPLGLVVITGVIAFNSTFMNTLQNSLANTSNGIVEDRTIKTGQMGISDALPPIVQYDYGPLMEGAQGACFTQSGVCIQIPRIDLPETVGGLGGDDVAKLALVLDQLPEILKEKGVDPDVVDKVSKLANMGHSLADRLQQIEQLCGSDGTCNPENASQVKALLSEIKKGDLTEFLKEWENLNTYLKDNPDALAAFPEAYQIIQDKVTQINTLIGNLTATDQYETEIKREAVTCQKQGPKKWRCSDGTVTSKPPKKKDGYDNCKGQCKETTKTTREKNLTGVVVNNPNADKVHQNANEICQQGGSDCIVQTNETPES